jgi:hypothetical protein
MIDIIRAIRKMPLDHPDKNTQKKIISESRKYFWDAPYLFKLGNDGDYGDEDPFGLHPMCCRTCSQSIGDLYTSADECLQAMEAMKQRMEDLEHVVGDNFKLLNRNVHKLFGMVGNMRGKWCNICLKYH